MPLSPPPERRHIHTRTVEVLGYARTDGLYDVEARLTDAKTYGFANEHRGWVAPGEPIHDMLIRLTIDGEMTVRAVEATTDAGPFAICGAIAPDYERLKGAVVGPGWRARIKQLFGGVKGCTHLTELLGVMATVAYQTLYARRQEQAEQNPEERPAMLDTCHALASDGEAVKRFWPRFYSGS